MSENRIMTVGLSTGNRFPDRHGRQIYCNTGHQKVPVCVEFLAFQCSVRWKKGDALNQTEGRKCESLEQRHCVLGESPSIPGRPLFFQVSNKRRMSDRGGSEL